MTQLQRESTGTGSIVDIEAICREQYSRFLRFAVANEALPDRGHAVDVLEDR